MNPRRRTLRVQMALQYALITLCTGLVILAVNFGAVERDTGGLPDAIIGVGVITVVALATGWGIARYALRPLRAVTAKAKQISATSLHQRIGLEGPDDELQQLATTIDALLARLEASFERERRFVANASHEIRTPLAVTRTALELGLDSPTPTVDELRSVISQALDATARSETLAADLLLLAQSESVTVERLDQFDLAELANEVINDLTSSAVASDVEIFVDLASAPMQGNTGLIDRLIANLVDNAVRHNAAGGWVDVVTRPAGDHVILTVRNYSPVSVAQERIEELFEPFHRGADTPSAAGHGLGLSIVRAIALSHGARMRVGRNERGDVFQIEISFGSYESHEQQVRNLPPSSVPDRSLIRSEIGILGQEIPQI